MSRQTELERILQAWYEYEFCATSEKRRRREALNRLLDDACKGTHLSRHDLIEALR